MSESLQPPVPLAARALKEVAEVLGNPKRSTELQEIINLLAFQIQEVSLDLEKYTLEICWMFSNLADEYIATFRPKITEGYTAGIFESITFIRHLPDSLKSIIIVLVSRLNGWNFDPFAKQVISDNSYIEIPELGSTVFLHGIAYAELPAAEYKFLRFLAELSRKQLIEISDLEQYFLAQGEVINRKEIESRVATLQKLLYEKNIDIHLNYEDEYTTFFSETTLI